jgi:hypothetical protein
MKLLALITGKSSKIFESCGLPPQDFSVVKIDEKDLAKPAKMLKLIKTGRFDEVYFGTIELELQRFRFFMFLYIFLTSRKGGLIDEYGAQRKYNTLNFLFKAIPMVTIESIATLALIPYYYIKCPLMQWKLRK